MRGALTWIEFCIAMNYVADKDVNSTLRPPQEAISSYYGYLTARGLINDARRNG